MVKALIVVIWLAVPVSGYCLARADYANYLSESQLQRTDCLNRADILGRYTRLIGQQAGRITEVVDANSRAVWQRHWRSLERDLTQEQLKLAHGQSAHYPATDAKLGELEQLLDSQRASVEDALRERDAYNKAGGGLEEMLFEIKRSEGIADYYHSIGAQGIYELIRDDVRQLQSEYRQRLSERDQRNVKMREQLDKANLDQAQIIEGLTAVNSAMAADEQVTYTRELRQRFESFSLPRELSRLLGMPVDKQR